MAFLPAARVGDLYDDNDVQLEGSPDVIINGVAVARVGDLTEGHICSPPFVPPLFAPGVAVITGSGTVLANGVSIARVGDMHDTHLCGGVASPHTGKFITGSADVLIGD